MQLRRWTPFTFLAPGRYVDRTTDWDAFDLEGWSRSTYEWTEDPWNGVRDFARPPSKTIAEGRGDCEDYALVAASWALARGREGVGIAFCWEWPYPWPRHVIAYDADRVYSSGAVVRKSVPEWVRDSRYGYALKRRIRG